MDSVEAVPPGHTQHIRQVQPKVDEAPTSSSQVSFGEEGADEETLHDRRSGKRRQEEKHNRRVAVRQDVSPLRKRKDNRDYNELVTEGWEKIITM